MSIIFGRIERLLLFVIIAGSFALLPPLNAGGDEPPVTVNEAPNATETLNGLANGGGPAVGSDATDGDAADGGVDGEGDETRQPRLRFSFDATPWRTVIRWLAEESDFALHVGSVPPGSFTYTDSTAYTPDEAIDRINLFLIPQGFTLVRSGRLISVISLDDPRSVQQLEAMAELVTVDELSQRGRHDVVRCLFPLSGVSPSAVVQELRGINLMTEPVILPQTKQLLITETAGKLRAVSKLLTGLETPQVNEEVVQRFELEHQSVDDVLDIVRPHLGLQGDELVGLGLSISRGRDGESLFVTGSQPTIEMLDSLIALIDVPGDAVRGSGAAELRSHVVTGNNLQLVYEVLQTLLAGESIRLSMERESNSIVAYAPPALQQTIADTITELQAPSLAFEVVELHGVDPYFAISLLNEMFGISTLVDEDDDARGDAPRIDADPAKGRLFVRGKPSQIAQVREVIEKLAQGEEPVRPSDGGLRVLSLPGQQARQVLETAERFWDGESQVIVYPHTGDRVPEVIERDFHSDQRETGKDRRSGNRLESADALDRNPEAVDATSLPDSKSWVSRSVSDGAGREQAIGANAAGKPLIKTQVTPQGILIQSDDPEAAARFEEHLRRIAGPASNSGSPPVVFYLKYVKANDATRMLADLLDGALSLHDTSGNALVQGYVAGPSSGLLGSFLTSREETTTMTAGSATVVSDARLNRLIVQGTVADIEQIEGYLKIIDKDESVTAIETYGQSRIIELLHTDAEEVAEVIRDAYPGRIAEESSPTGRGGRDGGEGRQREGDGRSGDDNSSRREGQRQPEPPKPTRSREPMLALAVHPQSNSLVVTAPESLLAEVEQLARSIDQRSEQDIQVIAPGNPEAVQAVIQGLLNGQSNGGNGGNETRRSTRSRDERSNRGSR
jgi:type II secretory pathway component GspD/PulD (secretin)